MNKKAIKASVKEFLVKEDEVIFAYIFGSFVESDNYRDIDIALYFKEVPELLEIGGLTVELEKRTGKKTDAAVLNNLYTKKPAFAHKIITRGKLIMNKNSTIHNNYKTKVLLRYFDTARLRKMVDNAFRERIETNNFGKPNYG